MTAPVSLSHSFQDPSALAARVAVVRENAALRANSSGNEALDIENRLERCGSRGFACSQGRGSAGQAARVWVCGTLIM